MAIRLNQDAPQFFLLFVNEEGYPVLQSAHRTVEGAKRAAEADHAEIFDGEDDLPFTPWLVVDEGKLFPEPWISNACAVSVDAHPHYWEYAVIPVQLED